eukprot:TRINITY_DN6045_c0_g1_i1.p1 TRINITY_DN6045_c0_g1~~TRINITY_DN6045_c0_g1_i1.p1  ORF type:complete len:436 (+),score=83.58 TRINITY_DN6045_c0_g1_i1:56-1309(+)
MPPRRPKRSVSSFQAAFDAQPADEITEQQEHHGSIADSRGSVFGQIAAQRKSRRSTAGHVMRKRLMELADKAASLKYHQGEGLMGPKDHPLRLTQLCGREMIDPKRAGVVLYAYDGAGSYFCRECQRLFYGVSRHCAECIPPFDLCLQCFTEIQERERGQDRIGRMAKKVGMMLRPGQSEGIHTPGGSDKEESPPPTPRECLRDARDGKFDRLMRVLYPKSRAVEDIAAEAALGVRRNRFDFAVTDKETGRSMLHHASECGADKVVFGLLMRLKKEGVGDVDGRDRNGLTALMAGAMYGRTKCVEELLYSDADTEVQCEKRYTALMLAAIYGHADCASRLLHGGAEVSTRSVHGRTALALACLNGRTECSRIILEFNPSTAELCDSEGYPPVLLAAARGHHDIVQLFPRSHRESLRW